MNIEQKLQSKIVNDNVMNYLFTKLEELYIIDSKNEGTLFELMYTNKLIGWDNEISQAVISFLNDDDLIIRGILTLNNKKIEHSWIIFKYRKREYVLDPSLNILCKKHTYNALLNPDVTCVIHGKCVKDELISKLKNNEQVFLHSYSDITTPLYNNTSGYEACIENNKIKKLVAHFYHSEL